MLRKVIVLVIILCICKVINAEPPEYDEEICIGKEDGVQLAAEGYCTFYYYCEGEIGYRDDCKAFGEFQFDASIGDCNYDYEVNCVEDSTDYPTYPEYPEYPEYPDPEPEVPAPDPVTPPPPAPIETTTLNSGIIEDVVCPTNRNGEILFFESLNCTEYYICANGVKLTMKCSDGFVFNKDENQCDHPVYNPRCSNLSFDPNKNVKCNRHGFYTASYPTDCSKYVFCAEGIPMVQICPVGTAWHIDRCVARQYAQCFDAAKVRY